MHRFVLIEQFVKIVSMQLCSFDSLQVAADVALLVRAVSEKYLPVDDAESARVCRLASIFVSYCNIGCHFSKLPMLPFVSGVHMAAGTGCLSASAIGIHRGDGAHVAAFLSRGTHVEGD